MILIQVVVHIIHCIDSALGVPSGYRLRSRDSCETEQGLLNDGFSANLLALIMRQEENADGMADADFTAPDATTSASASKSHIVRLRESMKEIVQLLQRNATLQIL